MNKVTTKYKNYHKKKVVTYAQNRSSSRISTSMKLLAAILLLLACLTVPNLEASGSINSMRSLSFDESSSSSPGFPPGNASSQPQMPMCSPSDATSFQNSISKYCSNFTDGTANTFVTCLQGKGLLTQDAMKYCAAKESEIATSSNLVFLNTACDSTKDFASLFCCMLNYDQKKAPSLSMEKGRNEIVKECLEDTFPPPFVCQKEDSDLAVNSFKPLCSTIEVRLTQKIVVCGAQKRHFTFSPILKCLEEIGVGGGFEDYSAAMCSGNQKFVCCVLTQDVNLYPEFRQTAKRQEVYQSCFKNLTK